MFPFTAFNVSISFLTRYSAKPVLSNVMRFMTSISPEGRCQTRDMTANALCPTWVIWKPSSSKELDVPHGDVSDRNIEETKT